MHKEWVNDSKKDLFKIEMGMIRELKCKIFEYAPQLKSLE